AWDLRRQVADWVGQNRAAFDAYQRSTMLVTGGAEALQAQAIEKTLATVVEKQAFNDALNQGQTVEDAQNYAIAAGQNIKPPADNAWMASGLEVGGESPTAGQVYVVDDFGGTYSGTNDGVTAEVAASAPNAILPGSIVTPPPPAP